MAPHRIVDGRECPASRALEHGQELRSGEDIAGAVAVIGGRAADHSALTIDGRVGRLHRDFGPAVAVKVEDLELGVVRARADVAAKIDAPQAGAVQAIRVDIDVAGIARLRVVLRVDHEGTINRVR